MKEARSADWIRRLSSQPQRWSIALTRFATSGIPSIGDLEIPFQSPLTVLAGPNGAGKTTLLRAIWAALEPSIAIAVVKRDRKFIAGTALLDVNKAGNSAVAEVKFGAGEIETVSSADLVTTHIDGAAFAAKYRPIFSDFDSVDDIVNGAGPRDLDAAALAEVNYILGRDFRSVTLFEVEMDEVVPFFEVAYGDDRYDSRTMGSGEMAALYLWWSLSGVDEESVILIEEPEAYLSMGSQEAMAKFIVATTVKRRCNTIASSHSPALISIVPADSQIFLSRRAGSLTVVSEPPHPSTLGALGIKPTLMAVIYVEDAMAVLLTRAILESFNPLFSREVFVGKRDGEGEVKNALKYHLNMESPVVYIGLFDGDMRDSDLGEYASVSTFLPGDIPTERSFQQLVKEEPNSLQHPNIEVVLAALEGKDIHDWYAELAKETGLSRDQLFSRIYAHWIAKEENRKASMATYEAIYELVFPADGGDKIAA